MTRTHTARHTCLPLVSCLLGALAPGLPVHAGDSIWINSGDGDYGVATNWSPAQMPGQYDQAIFLFPNTYTVTFNADHEAGWFDCRAGDVTFRFPGAYTYRLNDITEYCRVGATLADPEDETTLRLLGTIPGQFATLAIDNLIRIAEDADSAATLDIGPNARMQCGAEVVVGGLGEGHIVVHDGGSIESGNFASINDSGSPQACTALVTGPGSSWQMNGRMRVASWGEATLTIENGGTVSSLEGGTIGENENGNGTALVTGAGSNWSTSGDLYVGEYGDGVLTVENGGTVDTDRLYVGYATDFQGGAATGEVTIDGPGSHLDAINDLIIGSEGSGTLTVQSGGRASSLTGDLSLGEQPGGDGTAHVTGAGSILSAIELKAGDGGTGQITIDDDAMLQARAIYLGYQPGASGTLTMSGPGVQWQTTGPVDAYVGENGSGQLRIDGSATPVDDTTEIDTWIGTHEGASGTLEVDGVGSGWRSQILAVGGDGDGDASITNGATVVCENVHAPSGTGTANIQVDGPGSTLSVTGNVPALLIGDSGPATLAVTNGGRVDCTSSYVRNNAVVTIDGPGSEMSGLFEIRGDVFVTGGGTVDNAGLIFVGHYPYQTYHARAELDVSGVGSSATMPGLWMGFDGRAILRITDGGTITTTSAAEPNYLAQSHDTWAYVDGVNSTWTMAGDLIAEDHGELFVTGGGRVDVADVFELHDGSRLVVSGGTVEAGSLTLQTDAVLGLTNGSITIEGGTMTATTHDLHLPGDGTEPAILTIRNGAGGPGFDAAHHDVVIGYPHAGELHISGGSDVITHGHAYVANESVSYFDSCGSLVYSADFGVVYYPEGNVPPNFYHLDNLGTFGPGDEVRVIGRVESCNGGGLCIRGNAILTCQGDTPTGTVTINGDGSNWFVSGQLHAGNAGPAEIIISDGGRALFEDGAVFGPQATLRLDDGRIQDSPIIWSFGLLAGSGQLETDVLETYGTLAPGTDIGMLAITGDWMQEDTGNLEIDLSGPQAVTEHDVLAVGGTAYLEGTLDVALADGYTPGIGTQFEIITAGAIDGTFEQVNPAGIFSVSYETDRVVLTVVTAIEPADINGDGAVDVLDLLAVVLNFGPCPDPDNCAADIDGDGEVNVVDLIEVILAWG